MRRRAEGEDVEDHAFVVAGPLAGDEAARVLVAPAPDATPCAPASRCRAPSSSRRADRVESASARTSRLARVVAVEVLPADQHAGQQQRGVDRGELDGARTAARSPCRGSDRRIPCSRSTPVLAGPCGAVQKKRSVVSTRSRAASRLTQPRSTPIGYAVSAKPTAATLENDLRRPAVRRQAVARVGRLPEEVEGPARQRVEEGGLPRARRVTAERCGRRTGHRGAGARGDAGQRREQQQSYDPHANAPPVEVMRKRIPPRGTFRRPAVSSPRNPPVRRSGCVEHR